MKKTIGLAAATMILTATGAFAQATMTPAPAMKSTAPKADGSGMKADTSADADTAMAKPKHHAGKSKAALNASEAETTKQLNMEQAQQASAAR